MNKELGKSFALSILTCAPPNVALAPMTYLHAA